MKNTMKKYKPLIVLATLFFTLTAWPSSAADSPSAEELAKMNAAVAKITALIADSRMAVPLHILANQLKTSSDPEAIEAGAKIEKMADDMSSSSSGGGMSPHSGTKTIPPSGTTSFGSKTTIPAVMLTIPSGMATTTVPMSSSSYTKAYTGGTTITPPSSGIKPVTTKPTEKMTTKFYPAEIIFK